MEQEKRIHLAHLTTAQYDAILNHCNSNIFVTDGQGLILYANDAAERALNCTFDRLRQMDIYQLRADGSRIVAMSAMLTTSMASMKETVKRIRQEDFGYHVHIIVGGGPITPSFARELGVEFSGTMMDTARLATEISTERREKPRR